MSVGERITALRTASSLSQNQLADRMGVSRQAVSKWENDLSCPDPLRLIQLADALNTDVEYLATGKHSEIKVPSEPVIIRQVVEKPVYIEKVVEKPVYLEKPSGPPKEKIVTVTKEIEIPVERVVERVVEKPVIKKVFRIRYRTNPLLLLAAAACGFIVGMIIGFLL